MSDTASDAAVTRTETVVDRIEKPIDQVWPVLSDFGGIGAYMPGVKVQAVEGEGVGAVRVIPTSDGGVIREQLVSLDAAQHRFSYRVLDPSGLAMSDYVGDVSLAADGPDACVIEWSGRFVAGGGVDADRQKRGLEFFYRSSIEGLKALLAGG